MRKDGIRLNETIRWDPFELVEIQSDWIWLNQKRWDRIQLNQMRWNEIRWYQIRLASIRWNHIRSDDIETDCITRNQTNSDDRCDKIISYETLQSLGTSAYPIEIKIDVIESDVMSWDWFRLDLIWLDQMRSNEIRLD